MSAPRLFELVRHHDVSGVSGTGVVAQGVQWSDKTVSLRWGGATPSFSNWASIEHVIAAHGHQGATVVRWLDGAECACAVLFDDGTCTSCGEKWESVSDPTDDEDPLAIFDREDR